MIEENEKHFYKSWQPIGELLKYYEASDKNDMRKIMPIHDEFYKLAQRCNMTRDEAKSRFMTVASAEEMADLMLECFRIFGHDGTEQMLIEIGQGEESRPI